MNTKFLKLLIGLIILSVFTSCVVSKKKYTSLKDAKLKQRDSLIFIQDSLVGVVMNNISDFNFFMNQSQLDEKNKVDIIDSMVYEISKMSSNTAELQQSLRNAITEYEQEKKKMNQMVSDMELKTAETETLRKELEMKDAELLSLQDMVEKNRKETENLKDLISKALKSFDASELTVYQKNGKVYVSLEEKLLFKTGSAKIDPKGVDAIIQIAKVLEKNPDISIVIEGHTDNVGSSELNWKLSTERSLAVVKIIEDNSKIDLSRITVAGRGMYSPISDNNSDEGKKKNRRIEIILTPNLETLYKIFE
ncbi:MAG: OmpA family protein [Bacteroidales bacterium]|nr:OmpA family protein [Bacteroidales bacterium]